MEDERCEPKIHSRLWGAVLRPGASLFEIHFHTGLPPDPQDAKRGNVTRFSRKSRMRLLKTLNSIPVDELQRCLFLTLTYHNEWGDVARDIEVFWKRLARRYPGAWCIWKIECQKRGAPHFHVFVGGVDFIPCEDVARHWTETIGGGPEHLRAGTNIERIRDGERSKRYASKYMGKLESDDCISSRVWGVKGRKNAPFAPEVYQELTENQFYRVRRIMRKIMKKRGYLCNPRKNAGVTLFIQSETGERILKWAKENP